MRIAKSKELYFGIPDNVWYSFFDSPYPGHKLKTAVDIYYHNRALFPFEEGIVKEIRKVRTPTYVPAEIDYLTIIEVKNFCLKILHVKPNVKVKEKLYLDDEIGELIISGFFSPWSNMHAHFELRDCKDRYRARGGFLIDPILLKLVPSIKGNMFEIVEKKEYYYWLKPVNHGRRNLTPLTYQDTPIEGGLPHYQYGAVFRDLNKVDIFGRCIKLEEKTTSKVRFFETNFEVFANDQKTKGVGIYCNQERIKLIGGDFIEGDTVTLRLV